MPTSTPSHKQRRSSLSGAFTHAAERVFGNERRSSFFSTGTVSFRGASGNRVLEQLTASSESGVGPLTFHNVLQSHPGMHYLLKFCAQDDLSSESLLFFLEVCRYKTLIPGIHRELAARKIYSKFLQVGAPMQLAVPETHRNPVSSALQSHAGPDGTCFDQIHADVAHSLRFDVFPRFVRSSHYFKLVNLTLEERVQFDIRQFDLCRLLGAGGFGMVLLVRRKTTGFLSACKILDKRIIISQNQVSCLLMPTPDS